MILELDKLDYEDVKDVEKGLILCHPDRVEEVSGVIKQWIAIQMAEHYDKDPKKMIETNKHVLQFKGVTWLTKILLITN